METLQDRLEKFLKTYSITMQRFEQQCNIAQGLGKKLSEKSYSTTFKRISEGYPQLNIDWLKTGNGSMINPTPDINMTRYDSPGDNDVYGDIVKPSLSTGEEMSRDGLTELEYLKILLKEIKKQLEVAERRIEEKDERIGELKQQIIELKKNQV